jgi:hypothetical protein
LQPKAFTFCYILSSKLEHYLDYLPFIGDCIYLSILLHGEYPSKPLVTLTK